MVQKFLLLRLGFYFILFNVKNLFLILILRSGVMRRILFFSIIVLMFLTGGYSFAGALSGVGTATDPYLIQSLSDFEEFRVNNVYKSAGKYTTLTTDLDLSGNSYVGSLVTGYYYGTFDGNSKTISNVKSNGGNSNTAFFYAFHGILKNLNLTRIDFTGYYTAGICVSIYDITDSVENCYVQGSLAGSGSCAGITTSNSGTISNCFSDCIIAGGTHSGGLVAGNDGGIIENCHSSGTVLASGIGYYGGLVGSNLNGGMIRKCYSDAIVQGALPNSYHSALVGMQTGIVRDCFWNADINPGLFGCRPEAPSSDTIATGLSADNMLVSSFFTNAGWDFTGESINGTEDIWMMPNPGNGPALRSMRDGTYCLHPPVGDLSGDCFVDLVDFAIMASSWLECGYSDQDLCP